MSKQLKDDFEGLEVATPMNISIYSIDIDNKRITIKESWESIIKKYKKGDWVNGIIEKEVNFGYFIKIDTGIEGLLHRNNIKNGRMPQLKETIKVKIGNIDYEKKQIAFYTK
jgi:ribosomal protein S1